MNFKSVISGSYRILHIIGAVIWLLCSLLSAALLIGVLRMPEKNAWQYSLIPVLTALALVFLYNSLGILFQNFKSIEITDRGETILLKQFAKTITLHPEQITQVRLEEKYLLYSFSTKPRKMLVIEAPGVLWQVRSDIITSYDRVISYFDDTTLS